MFGYNACAGGTGGFVVPEHKIESWKKKLSEKGGGLKNPNAIQITDEELLQQAEAVCIKYGRVVSIATLRNNGVMIPSSEKTKFRFNGLGVKWIMKELVRRTGLVWNPYYRTEEQRERARQSLKENSKHAKDRKIKTNQTSV